MSTLVLAIETIGKDWESFSVASQQGMLRRIKDEILTSQQQSDYQRQVSSRLGLSPFTGQIISLAMYDVERDLGSVYFVADSQGETFVDNSFTYKVRTEKEMLEDFWMGAEQYDVFTTFNGRAFTLPFLYQRSAVHKVTPSVEIARERSIVRQSFPYHIDLLDELTGMGLVHPRPSLSLLADMYGVVHESVCAGEAVAEFFLQKKFRDLAERNANNVLTIMQLYKNWKQYLAPKAFINTIEM